MSQFPLYDPNRKSNYTDGVPKQRAPKRRVSRKTANRIATGVVVGLIVLLILVASFAWQKPQPSSMMPPAPIQTQTQSQTDSYTAFRLQYGPWQFVANDTVSTKIAILKQNGLREDGAKSVTIDASWQPVMMVDFNATEKSVSTIRVQTSHGAVYTLSRGQVFIIEGRPEMLYGVTDTLTFVQKKN